MDSVILGLLSLSPMTGYEIGCFIRQKLPIICSSSAGSVQAGIKKLLENECLTFEESSENGKNKKTFYITDKGRDVFMVWLNNPMQLDKVKNMELSKLFFLGFTTREQQIRCIEDVLMQLEQSLHVLEAIRKEFNAMNLEDNDIVKFHGYTLDYGIDSCHFQREWYLQLKYKLVHDK